MKQGWPCSGLLLLVTQVTRSKEYHLSLLFIINDLRFEHFNVKFKTDSFYASVLSNLFGNGSA